MGCPWMVHPNSVMRLSTILRPKLLTTTSWCVYKVLAMLNHCWSERRLAFNNHLYPNSTFTSRLEAFQNQSYLRSRPRPVERNYDFSKSWSTSYTLTGIHPSIHHPDTS